MDHLGTVRGGGEPFQLVPEDDLVPRSRGVEESSPVSDVRRLAVSKHGHQRDDAGASAHEQERPGRVSVPHEIASDRTAELEHVATAQLAGEVLRDLTVRQALHRDREAPVLGSRSDRVAALGLVSVFGGEADIDVLPRPVAGPRRDLQHDAPDPRRLVDQLDDLAEPPVQSPEYRCSRHGSP
jgi:hypothetical protein